MKKIIVLVLVGFLLGAGVNPKAAEQKLNETNLQKIVQRWELFWKLMHQPVEKGKEKFYQKEYVDIINSIGNLSDEELLWVQERIVKIEGRPMTEEEHWLNMNSRIQDLLTTRWEGQMEKPKVLVNKVLPIVMNTRFPDWMRALYINYIEQVLYSEKISDKDTQTIVDNLVIVLNDKVNSGPNVKRKSIEVIANFGMDEISINSIINAIDDKDEELLFIALQNIVWGNRKAKYQGQPNKFVKPALYKKLQNILNSPDKYSPKIVNQAILTIGSLQFPEGKEILLKKFKEEKDIKRLEIVMRSLCAYGDFELIEMVLKRRYSEELKDADISQVCNHGDEEYLLKFAQEKDGEILILALKELNEMPPFRLTEVLPMIEKKISHKDKWVRLTMLDMLEDSIRFEINVFGSRKDLSIFNKTLKVLNDRLPNEDDKELQDKIKGIIQTIEVTLKEDGKRKKATG